MPEPSLARCVLVALAAFHAAPLVTLAAAVLFAWLIAALNDGSPALMIALTGVLLLMFAIRLALVLAPSF